MVFQSPSRGGHLRGVAPYTTGPLASLFQSPSRGGHLRGGPTTAHHSTMLMFQSPSRGGHLRGHGAGTTCHVVEWFQSPSRGGHLRGAGIGAVASACTVRFSPLREGDTSVAIWFSEERMLQNGFSPLREGDTSVAREFRAFALRIFGFSPLREGDTSVARQKSPRRIHPLLVSVPFARGTPPWLWSAFLRFIRWMFQSPSRGGHLRGAQQSNNNPPWHLGFSPLREGDTSVASGTGRDRAGSRPFQSPSRGGHLRGAYEPANTQLFIEFQSPSRGGHLRGTAIGTASGYVSTVSVPFARGTPPWLPGRRRATALIRFSPLREGDTSVARIPRPGYRRFDRFSPLREGDTSVATLGPAPWLERPGFQSPSRGGHLRGPPTRPGRSVVGRVSVPFARGTPPWPAYGGSNARREHGFSPLREGDTSVARRRRWLVSARPGFSPLREGDTSVARMLPARPTRFNRFSPLREGDTSVATHKFLQSGSYLVSVPFARGTPPWR